MLDERELLISRLLEAASELGLPPGVEARYQLLLRRQDENSLSLKEAEELEGVIELAAAVSRVRSLARRVVDLTSPG